MLEVSEMATEDRAVETYSRYHIASLVQLAMK